VSASMDPRRCNAMIPAIVLLAATLSLFWYSLCLGLAAIAAAALISWSRRSCQHPLMELAAGIQGKPPEELLARINRVEAKKRLAGLPPTQDEELGTLDVNPTPRFSADDALWLEHLNAEGYAVVASVADDEALVSAERLLWDFLEKWTPWRRATPSTWTDQGFEQIGSVQNGIMNGAGAGQSDFVWHLRTLPTVRQVFEKIWETSNLIVSFDGANVFRPWHAGFRKTVCGWWHVDQGRGKQGRHAVQGFVSLYEANGKTGGLTVIPRSHLRFGEVVEDQQNPSIDYCTVQPYSAILHELPRRLVCCQPGDLVLWDSRTVHANAPAPEEPVGPADRLLRAVAYVCMTPASFAPEDIKRGRRAAYEYRFSTSHWPHKLDLGNGSNEAPRSLSDAPLAVRALVG